jgi:hypothetical protein
MLCMEISVVVQARSDVAGSRDFETSTLWDFG